MSIIRPIMRSIVRPIINSVVSGRWFSIFGGNHIELGEVLFPDSADFTLSFTIRPAAGDVGANTTILAQHTITAPRILTSGTDVLRVIYVNTGASSTTISATTDIVAGVDMKVKLVSSSITGTTIFINGVLESMSSAIVDHTVFGIDMIGSRHDHGFNFQGEIFDASIPNGTAFATYPINEASGLVVADTSYSGAFDQLPRRDWASGNGVDVTWTTNVSWPIGTTLTFDVRVDSLASTFQLLTTDLNAFGCFVSSGTGNFTFDGVASSAKVDGVSISSGDTIFSPTGGLHKIELVSKVNQVITFVGSAGGSLQFYNGVIGNWLLNNAGSTTEYRADNTIDNGNGTGTIPNTGNSGDAGALVSDYDESQNQAEVTAPTDGIWTALPERVRR